MLRQAGCQPIRKLAQEQGFPLLWLFEIHGVGKDVGSYIFELARP